jgi:hypothetical protein
MNLSSLQWMTLISRAGISDPGYRQERSSSITIILTVQRSSAIFQFRFAAFARAVDAAKNLSVTFNAVPNNPAIAMRASRRQRVDGALETVEGVVHPADDHFKRLVIFVVANLTCCHTNVSRAERLAAVFSFSSN